MMADVFMQDCLPFKSPASPLIDQPITQNNIKENIKPIKTRINGLCGGKPLVTGDWLLPLHKGKLRKRISMS